MKLKRGIALLLAAVFLFGTLAVPAGAAAAQPGPAAQAQTVDAEENDIISVRIKASGELTYGADHKLEIQTTPADAQYIGVVMGTSGQATGYVTLVLSEKIRTLLKLIPLPKKMSATPDQTEEFNVYSYLKQLIDGNDVSVLLRVGDEAVSVLNIINFYLPSAYVKTIQNVSNGQTSIGCRIRGIKDGKERTYYIYNNCDHEQAYRETGTQAVSFTTGVPAALGASMWAKGLWRGAGVFNVEEFDPDPFLAELGQQGLPWHELFDVDIEL